MMNALRLNRRRSVLFILLTLMTGLSFLLTGCGNGPTAKVEEPNAGQFALDFNMNPPDTSPRAIVSECAVNIKWERRAAGGILGTEDNPVTCASIPLPTNSTCSVLADAGNVICTDITDVPTRTAMVFDCVARSVWEISDYYGSNANPTTCAQLPIVNAPCAVTTDNGNKKCEDRANVNEVGFTGMGQSIPSLTNKGFTIEAWLKRKSDPLTGAIFSRVSDFNGISLYVEANVPAFGMRKCVSSSSQPIYTVKSSTPLADNEWHHIAATLVEQDHTAVHASCAINYAAMATSIAVDTNDKIHIVFVDNNVLKYATNAGVSGSSFIVQTIYSTKSVGTYISLALDSNNKPHVSFYNSADFDLMYAKTLSDGSWITTLVDATGDSGTYNSIAVDSTGYPHISYRIAGNMDVNYATNKTGLWVPEVAFNGSNVNDGKYTSIALDSSDIPYIIYFGTLDNGNPRYRMASRKSGSWVDNRISVSNVPGGIGNMSLAIDSSDVFHMVYYNTSDLLYSTCTGGDACWNSAAVSPGQWSVAAIIDSVNNVGEYPSLAIGPLGTLHVSYYDVTNLDLRYASCSAGCTTAANWTATIVDSVNDVGKFNDIAIDSSGNPHISYFDATPTSTLKYADNLTPANLTTDGSKQIPHLDIYVDGVYKGCSSTMENYSDSLTYQKDGSCIDKTDNPPVGEGKEIIELIGYHSGWSGVSWPSGANIIYGFTQLKAVVDDVRFWSTARTQGEINQCMAQELSIKGGTCGINNDILKGYWKFNTGKGLAVQDHSGSGNSGSKYYCDSDCDFTYATGWDWDGGWTTDSPF